jgi:hypothetical protein
MKIREKEGRMEIRGKNALKKPRQKIDDKKERQTRQKEKSKVG